jgi:hypothetical protein
MKKIDLFYLHYVIYINLSPYYTILKMNSQIQFTVNASSVQNVQHKNYTKEVSYEILNYDPANVTPETGIYRSIVVNPDTKEVFSFAPPKSTTLSEFAEKFPCIEDSRFQMNEIIEGTMVNLFYDSRISKWEIATKGAIGGNYWYYRNSYDGVNKQQLTFRQMFLESLGYDKNTDFANVELFNHFICDHVYSFVIQHPDNHIVFNIQEPKAFLVCVFRKLSHDSLQMVPLEVVKGLAVFRQSCIKFPKSIDSDKKYDILTFEDVNCIHPGYMILDQETGIRTKIENPNYVKLKTIRGNNPNLLYHYLCFTQAEQCVQFLEHFPMYRNMFDLFQKQVNTFIRHVHDAYVLYYVQKRGKQIRIPKHIMPHIWKLHFEIHLPSIQEGRKQIITKDVVRNYFEKMLPKEKWYYLNQCGNYNVAEECMGN